MTGITFFTRGKNSDRWRPSPMSLANRRTYSDELAWQEGGALLDYYVQAEVAWGGTNKKAITCPPEAPARFHSVTLI